MNRLTSNAMVDCHPEIYKSDSLKVLKLPFRFSLRAANSLATSIRQSLPVLCLWVLSIFGLLNLVCIIVELRAEKKISRLLHWLVDLYKKKFTYGYGVTYHTLFGFRKLLDLG